MDKRNRGEILLMAFLFTGCVGFIDYATGYDISLSVFYFAPVAFIAWYVGKRSAIIISLLASLVWISAELAAGHIYTNLSIPFWNTILRFIFLTFNALLLDAFHQQLENANSLAHIDPLTGLFNLRAYDKQLNLIISEHQNNSPFAVVFIDLDDFKNINDSYGHLQGDRLLCAVGETLTDSARPGDVVARVGGDEFSMLLPDTDCQSAEELLEKTRQRIAEIDIEGATTTCSFGAMIFTHPPPSSSEAMRLADDLMYTAKREGKNAVYLGVFDGMRDKKPVVHNARYGRRKEDVL